MGCGVDEFVRLQTRRCEAGCNWPFRSARVSSVKRCVDQPPTAFPPGSCRYQRRCCDIVGGIGKQARIFASRWSAMDCLRLRDGEVPNRNKQEEVVGNAPAFSKRQ